MNYQWNDYLLDTRSYRLLCNGEELAIEPQVFDLLIYLIENRDRVVTRNELLDNLWKGKVVSDSALNARLKLARKAVGDSGRKQSVIKTVHSRGYQFIASIVEEIEDDTARPPRDSGANEAGISRSSPSVVVMQFANHSRDPDQQYFSDGITHNIWSGLARIRSLSVKSAFTHDYHDTSPAKIAREMEVDYLLTGSVQREGERARVFAELIDCHSGETRWTEKYDRQGASVIDIQDDIARAIIAALWSFSGKIRELGFEHLTQKTANNFNAFDFILKGIAAKEKYTREGNLEAHYCFNQAKDLEPENAEALGWSAMVYILDVIMGWTDDNTHSSKQAYSEARRAITVDRNSEMGHWTLAACYCMDREYEKAFTEFDIALEINPNNPEIMVYKGTETAISGKFDEGVELILEGIRFNRNYPEWYLWHLGIAYFCGKKFDEVIDSLNRMSEQNVDTSTYLAASYALCDQQKEAAASLQEIFRMDSKFTIDRISNTHGFLSEMDFANLRQGLELAFDASTRERVIQIER